MSTRRTRSGFVRVRRESGAPDIWVAVRAGWAWPERAYKQHGLVGRRRRRHFERLQLASAELRSSTRTARARARLLIRRPIEKLSQVVRFSRHQIVFWPASRRRCSQSLFRRQQVRKRFFFSFSNVHKQCCYTSQKNMSSNGFKFSRAAATVLLLAALVGPLCNVFERTQAQKTIKNSFQQSGLSGGNQPQSVYGGYSSSQQSSSSFQQRPVPVAPAVQRQTYSNSRRTELARQPVVQQQNQYEESSSSYSSEQAEADAEPASYGKYFQSHL